MVDSKKNILVVGGAGFIGSHVVKALSKNNFHTIVYDNLSTGHRKAVLSGEFVEGDLCDLEKLDAVFKTYNIDAVMNFAGSIIVPESVELPLKYYNNNTVNSLNLLDTTLKNNVKNFIFSSTAAVYGLGEGRALDEGDPVNPINPYGRSKLMTEWMLEDASNANPDFNYIALRYFNVAGADPDGELGQSSKVATHLIKLACLAALGKREELKLFGTDYDTKDGTCVRDYIHIADLAQAHIEALKYLFVKKKSHVLNCGYGEGSSVKEVIKVVKEVSGVNFHVSEVGRRAGDSNYLIANPNQLMKLSGWKPQHNELQKMVKTAYEWEKKLWATEPSKIRPKKWSKQPPIDKKRRPEAD